MGFVDAFNRRQLQRALGYLAPGVQVTDCDYKRIKVVEVTGKTTAKIWLTRRFADRDTLLLSRVHNDNADQPTGVLAIEWARRRSNTLRSLGYPTGITPTLAAKVVFTTTGQPLIARFANGPFGGSLDACRPQ